jgi:hypothetical protein
MWEILSLEYRLKYEFTLKSFYLSCILEIVDLLLYVNYIYVRDIM